MPELQELIHESYKALGRGPEIGWSFAAMQAADALYPPFQTEEEEDLRNQKVEFVGELVSKVLAHPLEPVVFYRPGKSRSINDDLFHFFDVVTPNPERPVEFMWPQNEEQRDVAVRLNAGEFKVGKSGLTLAPTSFNTVVDARPDSIYKVNFNGTGNQWIDISPDKAFDEVASGTRVAVGSEEAGQLFSELKTDDDLLNGRLFGALFHIAWMAHDSGTKPAALGDFQTEKQAAIEAVHVRKSVARIMAGSSRKIAGLLERAAQEAELQTSHVETARRMYTDSIGEVYIQRLYENREVEESVTIEPQFRTKALRSDKERILRQANYQDDAVDAHEKQLVILESMV
jgi:hypothetical protein